MKTILVTGGAGYVGSVLVPKLQNLGYKIKVFDLFLYGDESTLQNNPKAEFPLEIIKGDIRDTHLLKSSLKGVDCVIHLACISNDPSFDLNPQLGKSINLDAFRPLVEISKSSGVQRFIYASSSSVYGVKEEQDVHEEMELCPLTDYSKYKADCEKILAEYQTPQFTTVTIRPATVCGYSPRQRLDVIVNILTNYAYHKREMKVLGGEQLRPNVHIEDMANLYVKLITAPKEKIAGKIYNFGCGNFKVKELANFVKEVIGDDIKVNTFASDDPRSYHISSQRLLKELDFVPEFTIKNAVMDLKEAFSSGKLPNSFTDSRYFNIQKMKELDLQ